jgi:predicted O-linked N-acetylglucosamine transferase (SPINDLY family)
LLAESRRFAERLETSDQPCFVARPDDPERRLRVGYVSGDFCRHPVGYFLDAVLSAHDPAAVEVYAYSNSAFADDLTDRLRGLAAHWRSLAGLSDAAAAALVAGDGIDILIDLAGHTARNRLPMFARRPAPVQATWLGFWSTTGLSAMDYILTDATTVRPAEESGYSERVLRLPGCRFCYTPPDYAPPPVPPPMLAGRGVTFGSFNNLSKIGPEVVRLWATVLRTVPGARLLLKWRSLLDPIARRRVIDAFAAEGIATDQLDLRGPSPHPAMLAEYGDMDIALDPFPFSGGLTSCEALWMGVPVVTLPGAAPASRQTLGFLRALGLDEWAAASTADYRRIAAALAADGHRLAAHRRDLRRRMAESALCDGPAFTRQVEAAYRAMWRRWCDRPLSPAAR